MRRQHDARPCLSPSRRFFQPWTATCRRLHLNEVAPTAKRGRRHDAGGPMIACGMMSSIHLNSSLRSRLPRSGLLDRRGFTLGLGAGVGATLIGARARALADVSTSGRAIAMHGEPALPDGFGHFPYADPDARRGGRLV